MHTQRQKICLIDGNSYIHRAYHAIRSLTNSRGIPTNAVYGYLTMLTKVLKDEKPDYVAVVFDSKGPTFRHALFPAYKANRPPMPDDLAVQVDYIHRLTEAFGVASFARQGLEADDILATLGRRAVEHHLEVEFITGDKDIQQLIGEHVTTLDTMKELRVTRDSFIAEKGYPPERLADVFALMGDHSDNVPGVRGIGPKTAEKLIREFGSLEELYRRLDELPVGKVKEILAAGREDAFLSLKLVTLAEDVDVQIDWEKLQGWHPDRPHLKKLFEELEFRKFLRELDLEAEPAATAVLEVAEVPPRDLARWRKALTSGTRLAIGGDATPFLALTADGAHAAVVDMTTPEGAVLRELLHDKTFPKTAYDLKAHMARLGAHHAEMRGADFDVLIAAYLVNPSEKANTLADLATVHLGSSALQREGGPRQKSLFPDEAEARRRAVLEAAAVQALHAMLARGMDEIGVTKLYREVEHPLIAVLAGMEAVGVTIDQAALREMSGEMAGMLSRIEERIYALAGTRFNIASPKQLAEILFVKLGLPAARKTKTGFSTDEDVLTGLAVQHELPAELIAHRQLSKLKNTYVDVLPGLVSPRDGRIHTTFNQAATATGRLSSSEPNLQNIPVRSEWGARIRKAFIPRAGWTFVSADYSQVELRILAHLSGDAKLRAAFMEGADIHTRTAAEIFGIAPAHVSKEQRRAAKVINFGIIYGMSPFGLARELGVDQREAKKYIDNYFQVYDGVRTYLDGLVAAAKRDGYVSTLFGRRRYLPELRSEKPAVVQFAQRAALNTPIQGTAADIIKMAMVAVDRRLKHERLETRLLLQIHDELLLEAPPGEERQAVALVRECMEGAVKFEVPVSVEVSTGPSWGDAH